MMLGFWLYTFLLCISLGALIGFWLSVRAFQKW